MDIREVDVNDDEDFHGFYEAMRVAELHGRPEMPMWSEHDAQVVFRRGDPTETMTGYVAVEGELVLGAGIFTVIHNSNVDKAFLEVLVRPEHRGHGVGTALEAHLAGLAAGLGRTNLIIESHIPADQRDDHPHRRFAERCGYTLANVEIKRFLSLPVGNESLDRWQAEAEPYHQDYRVETYVNDIPEEILESYCDLQGQLALEAPTGELEFEAEVVTIEAFRARQAKNAERGLTLYATVAVDQTGEVVAHSVLAVPRDDPGNVYQFSTLVRSEHRGHRLGMATKVRNLRAMQAAHPERTKVVTQNAENNGPMVRINEQIGFVPVELAVEFQRFIPAKEPALAGQAGSAASAERKA